MSREEEEGRGVVTKHPPLLLPPRIGASDIRFSLSIHSASKSRTLSAKFRKSKCTIGRWPDSKIWNFQLCPLRRNHFPDSRPPPLSPLPSPHPYSLPIYRKEFCPPKVLNYSSASLVSIFINFPQSARPCIQLQGRT